VAVFFMWAFCATKRGTPCQRGDVMIKLNDIYHTVQGEGAMCGTSMVLVRLHGCAVGCSFCDTKETWALPSTEVDTIIDALGTNAKFVNADESMIRDHVRINHPDKWVMVTGGEPFEQDLSDFVMEMHSVAYKVAVETSGTAEPKWHDGHRPDWITCSPKEDKPVLRSALGHADELKFVIGRHEDIERMEAELNRLPDKCPTPVFVQPMSATQKTTQLCVDTVLKSQGKYCLSIQVHKTLGLR